jgi:hypothetical protein
MGAMSDGTFFFSGRGKHADEFATHHQRPVVAPLRNSLGKGAKSRGVVERVHRTLQDGDVDEGQIAHPTGAVAQALRAGRGELVVDRTDEADIFVQRFRFTV